jgi:hypothetical protein
MNLDARIAAAFSDTATSDIFEPLIRDVEVAAQAANAETSRAKDRALDPTTPAADVTAARRAMEDAQFQSDRMRVAAARLRDRHRTVQAAEENALRKLAYGKVLQARDALAKELAALYPPVATQLAELMQRIAANNREVAHVNGLPDGAQQILVAELVARGILGFMSNGVQAPSIVEELRLPAFHHDQHAPYAWSAGADNTRMPRMTLARIG